MGPADKSSCVIRCCQEAEISAKQSNYKWENRQTETSKELFGILPLLVSLLHVNFFCTSNELCPAASLVQQFSHLWPIYKV